MVCLLPQVTNLMSFLKNFNQAENFLSILITKITQLFKEFLDMNDSNKPHRGFCDFTLRQMQASKEILSMFCSCFNYYLCNDFKEDHSEFRYKKWAG